MKILSRLIALAVSIACLLGTNIFSASADGAEPVFSSYERWLESVGDEDPTELAETENIGLSPKCRASVLMEQSTGEILFEQNPDEKLPIASVTKVMTLLLTCEAIDNGSLKLTDMITVSENAASMGGSQAYMEVGEQLSVDEMLKAVVVSSCNDGAVALAEHIGGSEQGFVALMNKRADELGMKNTEFINPTGLDDGEYHLSTARDVAICSRELLSHDVIYNYTTIWMDTIRDGQFGLSNTNKLIRFYPGATGLKTGSTSKAKYCLSASAKRDGMQLIAVILGADSSADRFSAAKLLLDYGFANYAVYKPENFKLDPIRVWSGSEKYINPQCKAGSIVVKKSELSAISSEIELPEELTAPISKGAEIGSVVYKLDGKVLKKEPIVADKTIEKLGFSDIFRRLLSGVFLCR